MNVRSTILVLLLWGNLIGPSMAQTYPLEGLVSFDTWLNRPLLDFQNRQTDKQTILLEQNTDFVKPELILGFQMRNSLLFANTSEESKFPYLGRFPTGWEGTTASDARILQANLSAVGNFTPWVTGHVELLFSDVFTFPSFNQGSFQVRQAYAVFGDFDATPFYAFIGKKNVSFGDFGTLSPFTQSAPWHYFAPLAEGVGGGYYDGNLHLVATALNGSRGIRVVDSEERGHLNNFAVNASYEWRLNQESGIRAGAGYLHGTIYDADRAEHIDPSVVGPKNSAFDINMTARLNRLTLAGEYVATLGNWPVTNRRVTAYRAEAAYDVVFGSFPGWFSGSWSEGIQGPAGSEFEFNRQLVVGAGIELSPNVLFTTEYVESSGFAPLINITTVSDRDVKQRSVLFGLVLVL